VLRWLILGIAFPASLAAQATADDFLSQQMAYSRVRAARREHGSSLQYSLREVGISGAFRVYLRGFKANYALEAWVASPSGKYHLLRTYPFCDLSGGPGPKRMLGDGQVPEGFYRINRFNPASRFHLSLGIDYPNAVDRTRAAPSPPGSDIFIHGNCVTVGCIPITDALIEELYLLVVLARASGQAVIPVHLFPAQPDTPAWRELQAPDTATATLWRQLSQAAKAFEANGYQQVPVYRPSPSGYFLIKK
jgi:murein L,D-transpeptidase YafK